MRMTEKRAAWIQPDDNRRRVVANAVLLRQLFNNILLVVVFPGISAAVRSWYLDEHCNIEKAGSGKLEDGAMLSSVEHIEAIYGRRSC